MFSDILEKVFRVSIKVFRVSIIVFRYSFKFFEDYIRLIMLGSGWTGIQKCIDITVPSGLRLGLGWVNLEAISWDSIGSNLT